MPVKVNSRPTPGSNIVTPGINLCGLRMLDAAIDRHEPDLLISICGEAYERKAADPIIELYGPLTKTS